MNSITTVLRVAGVLCIFVDTVYVFRSSEIFRHKHGREYESTAHFVLKRVHGFRVEHGGVFVNRKDVGADDERRRGGQRLVADFHQFSVV